MDYIGLSKWLDVELKRYEPELIKTVYPAMWGYEGMHHTATSDLRLGLRSIVHARMDMVGRAVNYGGKATSIPLVNFGITLEEDKTAVGIAAAEWGVFDLEAEKVASEFPQLLQSRNLVQNYREALEKALREWMHLKTWAGDRELGMAGMFTDPYVIRTEADHASDQLNKLPPSDLYNWLLIKIAAFKTRNRLTNQGISALMSTRLITNASKRFTDGSGDGTPLKMFQGLLENITEINECSAELLNDNLPGRVDPVANKRDLLVLYANRPDVIDRKYTPIEITEPALCDDRITYRIVGYCATSEVRVKKPIEVEYIYYRNDAN